VSSVSVRGKNALALSEDGLVYAWGEYMERRGSGKPIDAKELLPAPIWTLRGVRVGSISATDAYYYAVADTGEVWTWGCNRFHTYPLSHEHPMTCPAPKRVDGLLGTRLDAVAASCNHLLALGGDGRVYVWG
jgi:alpha-tubulin suppressor-like RCC1 family protein